VAAISATMIRLSQAISIPRAMFHRVIAGLLLHRTIEEGR
jgi:hypothetical protein